jgi:hypothetical protein
MKRRWSELSVGIRKLVIAGAVFEGVLKVAALVDLARTPQPQVRGPRWAWATSIVLVNSVGGVPIAYFLFGRTDS